MRYPRRNIKDVDIQKLKEKLDGAKHFRVIGGGESMGMDEIRFNHTVKRGPRLKKLPYPMWTRQRRMSPKRRQKRNGFFLSFFFFSNEIIVIRSSSF